MVISLGANNVRMFNQRHGKGETQTGKTAVFITIVFNLIIAKMKEKIVKELIKDWIAQPKSIYHSFSCDDAYVRVHYCVFQNKIRIAHIEAIDKDGNAVDIRCMPEEIETIFNYNIHKMLNENSSNYDDLPF